MKTGEAVAILSRLGEKGILSKNAYKEINKDISVFLNDNPRQGTNSTEKTT